MKKFLSIIVAMSVMAAYGQTNNAATVSQSNGNNADVIQKNGATITTTQNNTGGVANTIVAKQFGTNKAKVNQNGTEQTVQLFQDGAGNDIMNLNQLNGALNKFDITQVGDFNLVTPFNQRGDKNEAKITQTGDRNKFGRVIGDPHGNNQNSFNNGLGNKLTIDQTDSDNEMIFMDQEGTNNTATFTQRGDFNFNRADQSGVNNQMTLDQESYNGSASSKNRIDNVYQSGTSNVMTVSQVGDKNRVDQIRQLNSSNNVSVIQEGDMNTVKYLGQTGDSNTAVVTQKGSGENYVGLFTQKGNGNDATVKQDGYKNKIEKIYVEGAGNTTNVTQTGDRNFYGDEHGRVIGDDNIINVTQSGNNNNAARITIDGFDRNVVTISQIGSANEAASTSQVTMGNNNSSSVIDVRGVDNNLSIEQIGGSNRVDQVWLYGSRNKVTFKQDGAMNKIKGVTAGDYSSKIDGDDNKVTAEQIGNENLVVNGVDVLGSDNIVTLKQDGNKNEFELKGSPFENNTVMVSQMGDDNVMTTIVRGASNMLKLNVETSNSKVNVTQEGDMNKVYGMTESTYATFEGQDLTLNQQGNSNEILMNSKAEKVDILQTGNNNFSRLNGTGLGMVKFVQEDGTLNNINLTFNSDLSTDNVDILQKGTNNMVKGLGNNQFGMFSGSNLMINQTGSDNQAMINANGTVSLTQTGNDNVASITQSAN